MQQPHKIFYKGAEDDFVVFVEDLSILKKYLQGDSTLPLIDILSIYKIFIYRQGGSEGILDEASKQELTNEFHSSDKEQIIKKILKEGNDKNTSSFQTTNNARNETKGTLH